MGYIGYINLFKCMPIQFQPRPAGLTANATEDNYVVHIVTRLRTDLSFSFLVIGDKGVVKNTPPR